MARKQAKQVEAVESEKKTRPIRLELKTEDVDRLEAVAEAFGLNNASYARMAVLKQLREDERRMAAEGSV